MSAAEPASALESALIASLEDEEPVGLQMILATGEILVPQMGEGPAEENLTLPFIERGGIRYALAFSSLERLAEFGLEYNDVVTMRGSQLGEAWPQYDEIWLAIDPGSDHGAAIPPEDVRSLPSVVGG